MNKTLVSCALSFSVLELLFCPGKSLVIKRVLIKLSIFTDFNVNLTMNLTRSNLHFSCIIHLGSEKKALIFPKNFLFCASKQLAIHFILATRHVCPLAIQEFFEQTPVFNYWQLIHWPNDRSSKIKFCLDEIRRAFFFLFPLKKVVLHYSG